MILKKMLLRHKSKTFCRLLKNCGSFKVQLFRTLSSEVQYTDEPNYPPILDISAAANKRREKLALHEKYRNLNTVEEKLFALNMPRYWGWKAIILKEGELPYNILPFAKYVTRTNFNETFNIPLNSNFLNVKPEDLVSVIKQQIQEAILFEKFDRRFSCDKSKEEKVNYDLNDEKADKDVKLKSILSQINRILIVNLTHYAPHLIDYEVDYSPRLEAFWKVGGFSQSPEEHRIRTEKLERDDVPFEWKNEDSKELEHWFQYFGDTVLQLRSPLPLEPISDKFNEEVDISELISPESRFSPDYHGFERKRRFGTTIPGFWPSRKTNEFGLLSFHLCNHLLGRPPHFGQDEHKEAIHAQALLAGYAWLHGQASYQGFSTFNEITYPLVSQLVVTDGQSFSFYTYQLNTMLMHKEFYDNNKRCNLCYGTPKMKLYEDIKGREFIGWNDDVILKLISMYLNKTSERDYDMKPNLNKTETYVSDITDDERRIWLHDQFRYMYSNRPRHHEQRPYEIYDWEWIYKIKFMTRPMEPRRRPFEVWQDPISQKKYCDHNPKYIPKKLRNPANSKKKYYNQYYPDAV